MRITIRGTPASALMPLAYGAYFILAFGLYLWLPEHARGYGFSQVAASHGSFILLVAGFLLLAREIPRRYGRKIIFEEKTVTFPDAPVASHNWRDVRLEERCGGGGRGAAPTRLYLKLPTGRVFKIGSARPWSGFLPKEKQTWSTTTGYAKVVRMAEAHGVFSQLGMKRIAAKASAARSKGEFKTMDELGIKGWLRWLLQ